MPSICAGLPICLDALWERGSRRYCDAIGQCRNRRNDTQKLHVQARSKIEPDIASGTLLNEQMKKRALLYALRRVLTRATPLAIFAATSGGVHLWSIDIPQP